MQAADRPAPLTTRRFQLVAFDMDDTLYPEMDYVRSGYTAVAQHLAGLANLAPDEILAGMWRSFAVNRRTVFDSVLAGLRLVDRVTVSSLVELYRAHQPRIALPAVTAEVLTGLRRSGAHLAVVTDGPLVMQQRKADALGLDRYVDKVIFTDSLPPGCAKPSPAAFQHLMDTFAVPAAQCVYVADNPRKDFVGPRQLGWFTVQFVPDAGFYREESSPPNGHPHQQIHDLRDILVQ